MRCGWGPYFRRTFEVQAGNSPLQGQSKPPAKLVVLIDLPDIRQKGPVDLFQCYETEKISDAKTGR